MRRGPGMRARSVPRAELAQQGNLGLIRVANAVDCATTGTSRAGPAKPAARNRSAPARRGTPRRRRRRAASTIEIAAEPAGLGCGGSVLAVCQISIERKCERSGSG